MYILFNKIFLYFKFLYIALFTSRLKFTREESVFEIDFQKIDKKIELVIFDFDDTLAEYFGTIGKKSLDLIKGLKRKKVEVVIFSNRPLAHKKQLIQDLANLGIQAIRESSKPLPDKYLQIMKEKETDGSKTVFVGDRIYTDLFGGYLAGISHLVLVEPYSRVFRGKKPNIFYSLIRSFERKIFSQDIPTISQ